MRPPFTATDLPNLAGPPRAFDPAQGWSVPALQNHLALEIVDHLVETGLEFSFRGGTALHSKLGTRARYSVDVDLDSTRPADVERALQAFARRFPGSVEVREHSPLQRIPGMRHEVTFPRTADPARGDPPKRVLVEVTEWDALGPTEPLPLSSDGLAWPHRAQGPSLSGFMGQKLSTLGPTTVGLEIGPNATHAGHNKSVAKQLFDLRALALQPLDPAEVAIAYRGEVETVATRRNLTVEVAGAVADARRLLSELQPSRNPRVTEGPAYALWSGFRDIRRFVVDRSWDETAYRVTGGVVARVLDHLDAGVPWEELTRPVATGVPPDRMQRLEEAIRRGDPWVPAHRFGESAVVAWAWSPRDYW